MRFENNLKNKNRIFGLDLMRATAIIMVVSSHTLFFFDQPNKYISQIASMFGFFGVELFFVLSGFLIGRILYRMFLEENFSSKSIFNFLQRRWLRTLPNYFLILLINIGIVFLINISVNKSEIWYYFFFLQNFKTTMLTFFPESWSLSIEEFAYMIASLVIGYSFMLCKPKNKSNHFFWIVFILTLLFVFAKIYYLQTTTNTSLKQWNISLKAVVIYRIDSILIGILASWISFNFYDLFKKHRFLVAIIGTSVHVVIYALMVYFKITIINFPFFWNVIYLPLTSILFAFYLPILFHLKSAPNWISKPITFISLISYSLYLVHYSIAFQLIQFYFEKSNLFFVVGFYLLVIFILSWVLYRYFEKPILDYRDRN